MADPGDDVLVDRKSVVVRGLALFLRYVAGRLDGRDVLSEHVQALVRVHEQLNAFARLLVPSSKTGTVVVLWGGLTDDGSGFISRTFDLPNDSKRDAQIEVYRGIPEGAWVVAHDCILTAVHVGDHSHDLGPIPRGKLVRLTHRVDVGDRLHLQLMRDNGAAGSLSGRYAG